jgi:hypothetical protein
MPYNGSQQGSRPMTYDRTALRSALFPVALRDVEAGNHFCARRDCPESVKHTVKHTARIVANYAATDILLRDQTLMLPMIEVRKAIRSLKAA